MTLARSRKARQRARTNIPLVRKRFVMTFSGNCRTQPRFQTLLISVCRVPFSERSRLSPPERASPRLTKSPFASRDRAIKGCQTVPTLSARWPLSARRTVRSQLAQVRCIMVFKRCHLRGLVPVLGPVILTAACTAQAPAGRRLQPSPRLRRVPWRSPAQSGPTSSSRAPWRRSEPGGNSGRRAGRTTRRSRSACRLTWTTNRSRSRA